MIEVEIRSKINNIRKTKKSLQKIKAKFIKKERQIDKIFGAEKFLDSENKITEGGIVARIRQVNGTIRLEFKEILRKNQALN